jgi:hypothetical protein
LTRLVAGAAFAAAAMTAIVEPANAGVSVGIGIGLPGPAPAPVYPRERWCYTHPGACGAPAPTFVVGTFYPGHGWWDGHAWHHDRFWGRGHRRYR